MKEIILASVIGMFIIYEFVLFIKAKGYVNLIRFDIKKDAEEAEKDPETISSVNDLFNLFLILIGVLIQMFNNKVSKRLMLGTFTLMYLVFLTYGIILSYYWYVYASILLLGVIIGFIVKYFKNKENWNSLVYLKKIDAVITISLLFWLFMLYFNS